MFISEEEKLARLKSPLNLLNQLRGDNTTVVEKNPPGRKPDAPNLTIEEKKDLIAMTPLHSNEEVAKEFNVSKQTVSNYKNEKSSLHEEVRKEVREAREKSIERINELALDRVMKSLNVIDADKLSKLSAREASSVAKNCAGIVQALNTKEQQQAPINFIIYSPPTKPEESYETLEVHPIPEKAA